MPLHDYTRLYTAPPVSPSHVSANKVNSGKAIEVSWQLLTPEEAWGFVKNYTISYRKESEPEGNEIIVPGTDSSVMITGVDPNHHYMVVIWASTKAGTGKQSNPISTRLGTMV